MATSIPITIKRLLPWKAIWTIVHPVERECRHVSQAASCGSYVAIFDLRVEPYSGPEPILFVNDADPSRDVQKWVPSIVEGITRFVDEKAQEGIAISGINVTLTHLQDHPIDARWSAFRRFTAEAMATIFEKEGMKMDEANWLVCKDPKLMLDSLRGRASTRKLRLFAAACCRRVLHLVAKPSWGSEDIEQYVSALEHHADRLTTEGEWEEVVKDRFEQ